MNGSKALSPIPDCGYDGTAETVAVATAELWRLWLRRNPPGYGEVLPLLQCHVVHLSAWHVAPVVGHRHHEQDVEHHPGQQERHRIHEHKDQPALEPVLVPHHLQNVIKVHPRRHPGRLWQRSSPLTWGSRRVTGHESHVFITAALGETLEPHGRTAKSCPNHTALRTVAVQT